MAFGVQNGLFCSPRPSFSAIGVRNGPLGSGWSMVRVWPDTGFSGQEVSLFMHTGDITGYWGHYEQHDRLKVRLYRFSKEFFRYGVALEHIRDNDLAEVGLAPAAYAYSNVSGGVGILASWTVRETNWFSL